MKMRFRKILCILMIFPIMLIGHAEANFTDDTTCLESDMLYYENNNQDEALAAYENLAKYLGLDKEVEEYVWPDEYAGCFINDDNKLVICLTSLNEEIIEKYISICGSGIEFQHSQYALAEVKEAMEWIYAYPKINDAQVGYSSKENRINISVESSESQAEIVKYLQVNNSSTIDSMQKMVEKKNENCLWRVTVENPIDNNQTHSSIDTIDSEENYMTQRSTISVPAGAKLTNNYSSFTLGAWVNKSLGNGNSIVGFITCGHAFFDEDWNFLTQNGIVYYCQNNTAPYRYIGTTNADYVNVGGYYDYAFVPLTSTTLLPSANLANGETLNSVYHALLPQGTDVNIYILGQKSGLARGTILNTTIPVTLPNSETIDIGYCVDITSGTVQSGDSGGPVYIIEDGVRKLVGFQSALERDGTASVAIAHYTLGLLQATLYTG